VADVKNLTNLYIALLRQLILFFVLLQIYPVGMLTLFNLVVTSQKKGLFVTLYAKSTDKMPRQHTSNPKIPKVSKAIASPFY